MRKCRAGRRYINTRRTKAAATSHEEAEEFGSVSFLNPTNLEYLKTLLYSSSVAQEYKDGVAGEGGNLVIL